MELSALSSVELNSVSCHLVLSWGKKKNTKREKTPYFFNHLDRILLTILLDLKVT